MKRLMETLANIKGLDASLMIEAQARLDNLTKPLGSLGRLEELAKQICGITGRESPSLKNKVVFTLAADHGVTDEGVSAYPKEVTAQMVYNFLRGGAGINVLANHVGARVVIADIGVAEKLNMNGHKFKNKKIAMGTSNMALGPAMTREQAVRSIEAGIEIFEEEMENRVDIAGTGDMGIGNTSASSAIASVFTGKSVESLTGRGTGIDDGALQNKIRVIKKAIEVNRPDPQDPVGVLAKVGGLKSGGLGGIILAAAAHQVPVVIDGFISGASALIAAGLEPRVKPMLIAAHKSVEQGHAAILNHLELVPLLDLNLRLGEGTGAALAMGLADASMKILAQMATFGDAGVSARKE